MSRLTARLTLWGCVLALIANSATLGMCAEPSRDAVRLRAALRRAEANDADAIPVLIDLLAELTPEQRRPVEEFLTRLAGEWAPIIPTLSEDTISRRIRRDCWAAWWRNTDGAALLAAIGEHTLTAETRKKVDGLIARLGNDSFGHRENATKELFALGRITLPQLQEASKNNDPEVARRAKQVIERIEREPIRLLPLAALRLLAVRKPAGAVEALLAYLPHAKDESRIEGVNKSLTILALRDGKPDPLLARALSASQLLMRVAAIQALAKGGGAEGRSAVCKLLKDDAPIIRCRAALALTLAKERDSIPVLIDLLAVLPAEPFAEVEDALYQLAGDSAPKTPGCTEPAERRKCLDAWAAWWKVNGKRADLARMTDHPCHGFTLICDFAGNRVYEIDRHGKQRWAIAGLAGPADAVVLPSNRVLIAEHNARRVTERDFKGKILWQKEELPGSPVNVQRLPNGNTFIATPNGLVLEVDRAGKTIYSIHVPGISAAYRSLQGHIHVVSRNNQCVKMDTTGKPLKRFAVKLALDNPGCMDVRPDGPILVASVRANKVVEFDDDGKILREVDAPGVTTPTALPEGHILAASRSAQRVFELDRSGKVVWEHKNVGHAYRARRR